MGTTTDSVRFPCPACGFLVFDEPPGSYVLCGVCDWEDDAVQLANPVSGGGANRLSLAETQQKLLQEYPLSTHEASGFVRDTHWRPLSSEETEAYTRQLNADSHWPNQATKDYYWRRSST